MFYLKMHLTHFIYGDIIIIVSGMLIWATQIARGNLLPPICGLLFLISCRGSFIHTISDRTVFVNNGWNKNISSLLKIYSTCFFFKCSEIKYCEDLKHQNIGFLNNRNIPSNCSIPDIIKGSVSVSYNNNKQMSLSQFKLASLVYM